MFNVLALMTGGPAVDPSTLTVVTQPASGAITFNSNFLVYTPAQTDGGSAGQLDLQRHDDRHPDRDDRHL